MAKRQPGEEWQCAACSARLVGARTINGKVAPIELDLADDGNCFIFRAKGEVRVAALGGPLLEEARRQGFELRHNHFATCPESERFRRPSQEDVRPSD